MFLFVFLKIFYGFFKRERKRQGERKGEKERERERNTDLVFHWFMHSSVSSCMCPDLGSNPQLWHFGRVL